MLYTLNNTILTLSRKHIFNNIILKIPTRNIVTLVETADSFKKAVSDGVAVAKFGAEWCGPCIKSKPLFEELSNKLDSVKFIELDIDKLPELAEEHGVTTIPMFVIYKNGTVVTELVGSDIPKLESEIVTHITKKE